MNKRKLNVSLLHPALSSTHGSAFFSACRHISRHLILALVVALLGVALILLTDSLPATAAAPDVEAARETTTNIRTWIGLGNDGSWSDPANWQDSTLPSAGDTVRFPSGTSGESVVDTAFGGTVAGVLLEQGFSGHVRIERDLAVQGDVVMAGGQFSGGNSPLTIAGNATITAGLFNTPAATMSVHTLDIGAPAIVRLATNGKLNITGDGMPLTGAGTVDTLTNRPNSVELTGATSGDLLASGPMAGTQAALGNSLPDNVSAAQQAQLQGVTASQTNSLSLDDDYNFWSAVIDTENGFAYFGTWTKPGTVVKVRLSDFSKVGTLTLSEGENGLRSAVIDAEAGYAYFGTYTEPGIIVKINLSTFTRESALTLTTDERNLTSAVIDPSGTTAYFGTDTKPGRVVKIDLDSFTKVGALTLNTDEDFLKSAVIDTENKFAYFGADTEPGHIVKINLTNFAREAARTLGAGEDFLISAAIDTTAGFAYFGTDTSPGQVIKLNLEDFSVVKVLKLNPGESSLASAVIDPQNGFAYFGTRTKPGLIVTVKLETFSRVNAQTLSAPNEDYLNAAVIDTSSGFVYFGTGFLEADETYTEFNKPGVIIRLSTTTAFTQSASLRFPSEEGLFSAVIDAGGEYAYFGTNSKPGVVVKVRTSDNTRVAALTLESGEDQLYSAAIDTKNGYAYFGTNTVPGIVVKVKLDDFTRVSGLTLETDEDQLRSAVLDEDAGFAYFGTRTKPGKIIKIQLSDFSRVGTLTLNAGEDNLFSAVIDSAKGYAYFGTETAPGIVVQIKLSDFTRNGALTLDSGENYLTSAVIDTTGEVSYAYFGTRTTPGKIVKAKLNDLTRVGVLKLSGQGNENLLSAVIDPANNRAYFGTAPESGRGNGRVVEVRLTDIGSDGSDDSKGYERDIELESGENPLTSAVINTKTGYAFFGTGNEASPGKVVKVKAQKDSPLVREGALTLDKGAYNFWSAVIDTTNGFAYFGTWSQPGVVAKVRLADFTRVGVLTFENGEEGLRSAVIDTVNGYAYFGTYTSPGRVIKVNLATFMREGVLALASGDNELTSAVIDTSGPKVYGYFGTNTSPGRIVKVDLSVPAMQRVAQLDLGSDEDFLTSAVIDPANGYAYFATFTIPGKVVKVDLENFSKIADLTFQTGENFLTAAMIDSVGGYAYFGANTNPGRVVKVKLVGLSRESAKTYSSDEARFASAVIDPQNGLGYLGTQTSPGRVLKINLETLDRVDTLSMENPNEDYLTAAVIDLANNAAYFGTGYSEADEDYNNFNKPGIVVKISLNQRADTKKSTSTALTSSPNPSEENESVEFKATVTGEDGTPTGTVTFYESGTALASNVGLNSGVAAFDTSSLSTGTHVISATYTSDGDYADSTANSLEHVVNQSNKEATTTTVESNLNPSSPGEQVKFSATVAAASGGGEPTGQVQFYVDGEKADGPRTLNNGVATKSYNKLVAQGTYVVTAEYLGDSQYDTSDSNALNQVVDEGSQSVDTTTTLTSTPNPSTLGTEVVFTAKVAAGTGAPTGSVTFLEGNTTLGTGTLSNGQATFSKSNLSAGDHFIIARYEGSTGFNASTSDAVKQTVTTTGSSGEKIYLPTVINK
jgi:hypothetical protein